MVGGANPGTDRTVHSAQKAHLGTVWSVPKFAEREREEPGVGMGTLHRGSGADFVGGSGDCLKVMNGPDFLSRPSD